MSVEAIVARIEDEAEAEAAAIVADADVRAGVLVEAARTEARTRTETALDRATPALRSEEVRLTNAARLRLLERRAEIAAGRTTRVFELAEGRCLEIAGGVDPGRWAAALDRLIAASIALAGSGATVRVRSTDAARVAGIAAAAGVRLELDPDPNAPPGPLVRSADGRVEIDATLPARFARARVALADAVASSLGLEG